MKLSPEEVDDFLAELAEPPEGVYDQPTGKLSDISIMGEYKVLNISAEYVSGSPGDLSSIGPKMPEPCFWCGQTGHLRDRHPCTKCGS
jgi:hypothetical protein